MHIGPGGGDNRIRIRPLAIHKLPGFLQPHGHPRLGIRTPRDRLHGIELQVHLMREGLPQRIEGGIHRAIPSRHPFAPFAIHFQGNGRSWAGIHPRRNGQRHQLQTVILAHHFVIHQRHNILIIDHFLTVREVFEAAEGVVQLIIANLIAHGLQLIAEGGAAGMLAHHQR